MSVRSTSALLHRLGRSKALRSPPAAFISRRFPPRPSSVRPFSDGGGPQFWNREDSPHGRYSHMTREDVVTEAVIVALADPTERADAALFDGPLPPGATYLGAGTSLDEFDLEELNEVQKPNVLFMCPSCPNAAEMLPAMLEAVPSLQWVHARSAGIDFVSSPELARSDKKVVLTNAKGQFSSTLAEYTMMACSYFAKDLPRLMRQKRARNWEKYDVEELRGKTMGIVGYGDIGRACAKLAHIYGMRIVALRRNPALCAGDPLCDAVYGADKDSLNRLMAECDYVVCSAPSTVETKGMVDAAAFAAAKPGLVFINLGRGPVVDEDALIAALGEEGRLKGAALDVFTEEPLPRGSALWDLDNVLLSPHNMDQTSTFMHEATEFFVNENLPRYILGEALLNPVDKVLGY
eukprot:CAMPEP_0194273560 /NCGR_PEP_ID=MMETSP0169-20130528/6871_1 /TAXON_ID=218684 /ORGANISM="Corethron pennatum, Strain L29A3" /LENGTH=406 /DNA_ID=CAMNT_0039016547 /DNA_START=40 /DNA_END=1260 /DNA_ORIENTATION=+